MASESCASTSPGLQGGHRPGTTTTVDPQDTNHDLNRAIEEVDLRGNLLDGERVKRIGEIHGRNATAFLLRAAEEGSPPVIVAALQALAVAEPDAAKDRSLALLRMPDQPSEVHAGAAEALSRIHSKDALDALILATSESALVSSAAIRALREHTGTDSIRRIRDHLRSLIEALAASSRDDARLLARQAWAVVGPDGRSGLLHLAAERCYSDIEDDLFTWWRTHPDVGIKTAAAQELLEGGVDNACAILAEGLPGSNEGHPTRPQGELDNGPLRHVLAEAAFVVLLGDESKAFDLLAPFFDSCALEGWFGNKRAEIILLLLLGQTGNNETSWLWGQADELHRRGRRPDSRWRELGFRRCDPPLIKSLADELSVRLSGIVR